MPTPTEANPNDLDRASARFGGRGGQAKDVRTAPAAELSARYSLIMGVIKGVTVLVPTWWWWLWRRQ